MQDVFEEQGQTAPQQGETPPEQPPPEQPSAQQPPPGGEAAPPAADTGKHVPLEALEAERKGRQDWKEKATRYEEQLKAARDEIERSRQQQPQVPQDPLVSLQQQIVNERFNTSEMLVREKFADTDEVVATFMEAAKQNPALVAEMNRHPHPWKFAYEEGKRQRFAAEIGSDPVAYRAKVEAEVRAELSKSQQPAAAPLPQSLAGARSAGARGSTFTGPTPMENLFPN